MCPLQPSCENGYPTDASIGSGMQTCSVSYSSFKLTLRLFQSHVSPPELEGWGRRAQIQKRCRSQETFEWPQVGYKRAPGLPEHQGWRGSWLPEMSLLGDWCESQTEPYALRPVSWLHVFRTVSITHGGFYLFTIHCKLPTFCLNSTHLSKYFQMPLLSDS